MEEILNKLQVNYSEKIVKLLTDWGPNLILALIILFAGLWLIKFIIRSTRQFLEIKAIDPTLRPFFSTLIEFLLKLMLFLLVASQIGIKTTSFIAILGAAGLAVGLALQGALANFAAGVLILIFRPFKVGDIIETQNVTGIVKEVSLFVTILKTNDLKTIILPNGPLLGGNISNYSTNNIIRIEVRFYIRYGDNIDLAHKAVSESIKNCKLILENPKPSIIISELSNINIECKVLAFTNYRTYWDAQNEIRKLIIDSLEKAGLGYRIDNIII